MAHNSAPLTRRELLCRCANGFGAVALSALFGQVAQTAESRLFAPRKPHFEPKVKNIIFLYMDGGPSQVDTFDYKPALAKYNGRDPHEIFKVEPTQFDNVGKVMQSPWRFQQHGQSGLWVSELFPHIARHVDSLAVVRSMTSNFPEHTNANYFLHTGHGLQGRPSMGAWATYGLGSENQNLPGFIVLNGGLIPPGGLDNFANGFLPATYQGSIFKPTDPPVAYLTPPEKERATQQDKLALMRKLDGQIVKRYGQVDELESSIANYEMAFRMQAAVPELMDLSEEPATLKQAYGFDHEFAPTRIYAAQCLAARRMIQRGVRFVELTCPNVGGDRWDQHSGLKQGHENNARAVDQPIAALLTDLKQSGLWDETLVVFAGEFGRTPFAQGNNGRDHNQYGFSVWLAGGGIRGGMTHGETDEFGYHAVRDKLQIHDLHATMLHLLGMNHEQLTFRFSGRDMRLTDVHGHVIEAILS